MGIALLDIVVGPVCETRGDEFLIGHHDVFAVERFERRGPHRQIPQDAGASVLKLDIIADGQRFIEQDDDARYESLMRSAAGPKPRPTPTAPPKTASAVKLMPITCNKMSAIKMNKPISNSLERISRVRASKSGPAADDAFAGRIGNAPQPEQEDAEEYRARKRIGRHADAADFDGVAVEQGGDIVQPAGRPSATQQAAQPSLSG